MGLNITLYRKGSADSLAGWDDAKLAGDKDFASLVAGLPSSVKIEESWAAPHDFDWHVRPADFAAWRAAIASREWPNPGRYEHLMDLLEANPDLYIYFSW